MGQEVTFGGDRFVHYLYCDDGFVRVYMSKHIKLYFKYM